MSATSPPCPERELLLHGLADGELDAANALALEDHLGSCACCAAAFDEIASQKAVLRRADVRFHAPPSLRARALAAIEAEDGAAGVAAADRASPVVRPRFGLNRGAALFSAMALAASLVLFVWSGSNTPGLDQELAAAHVRSLLAAHLTDVPSSDQHTVKPWFLGKLDFAPPVATLEKEDFPLIGGRLDYIGGRVVPALVYKRHGHIINVFVWPQGKGEAATRTVDGYHILTWNFGGFDYAAVSDLNMAELRTFREALEKQLSGP